MADPKMAIAQADQDARWMQQALALARKGIGLASPNPAVGCVILSGDGQLIGEGWHEYDQRDHAEIVALRAAGEKARGGTAYVTLEPCNHTGRTGPCSLALIEAGVARVVAATMDPNPLTAGMGLERLRNAGIAVTAGVGKSAAQRLNEGFAQWIQNRRPFVHMKVAMTLDGRIAPARNESDAQEINQRQPHWITGEEARAEVQQMRWKSDAVLTGIETVLADDPLLTDRSGRTRRRPLLRVVLDSRLRLPLDAKLVTSAAKDLMIFTASHDTDRRKALEDRGVRIIVLDSNPDEPLPLAAVMNQLGSESILTLLTETGTRLNTALLQAGLVDRLSIFTAPRLLGGDAQPAFNHLDSPLTLPNAEAEWFGADCRWSSLLRDPWQAQP